MINFLWVFLCNAAMLTDRLFDDLKLIIILVLGLDSLECLINNACLVSVFSILYTIINTCVVHTCA